MSDETESRKPRTPNFDRVVDAIERGDYDEKIVELNRALAKRRSVLQDRVLEQVRQVFGPDADITVPKNVPHMDHPINSVAGPEFEGRDDNPFVKKAERGGEVIRPAPPPPVTSATADQIDENKVMKDALENIGESGLPISEAEQRMMHGERVADIEHRGAIISGLSAHDIGD